MDPRSVVRLIVLLGLLVGTSLVIFGFVYPTSQGLQVEYVDEFNGEYVSEYNETQNVKVAYDDAENVSPSQIHKTYNSTEFTNTTIGKMKDIIGTNETFSIERDQFNVTNTSERFIVNVDETAGNQVYISNSKSDGSLIVSIFGLLMLIASAAMIGIEVRRNESADDEVSLSDDGEWKYYPKD